LVLAGCDAEAALEVAVEMALVGESGHRGDGDGRLASLEEASGGTEAVGDLQSMGRQTGSLAEEADETEFANASGGGELVEPNVQLGPVAKVVAGPTQGPVIALRAC
jgi:hypothetical protein